MATAQGNPAYVEVRGLTMYKRAVDYYQAVLEINTNARGYYVDKDDKPKLEEIANRVFEKLESLGFPKKQFEKSDKNAYYQNTYERAFYTFKTTSEKKYIEFTTMKALNGTYVTEKKVFLMPIKNREKIIAKALNDARKNAAAIAKAMGKTLGDILSVVDYNSDSSIKKDSYYPVGKSYAYGLSVRFAVE